MSGLERLILDLVQIAEAPVYSTYRWLGRELGRDMPLSEFLRIIGRAIERDVLRLWSIDPRSGDRTELFDVPPDLESRYQNEPELDERFDPFGLSLTLGATADVEAEPEWELDLDFDEGVFELELHGGHEAEALEQLARCYPDLRASVTARQDDGGVRRVVGTLTTAPRSSRMI